MSDETDDNYLASLHDAEWFAILARGNMGFRYGPYTAIEAGQIMAQCVAEGIPLVLSANCGREFDWDVARDFARGQPADWRPMSEAPTDGTEILMGIEEEFHIEVHDAAVEHWGCVGDIVRTVVALLVGEGVA